jgi:hypothetical protein
MFKIKLPAKDTYYYCTLNEYPELSAKAQLIQYEMLINPANIQNVHHVLVYECYPGKRVCVFPSEPSFA